MANTCNGSCSASTTVEGYINYTSIFYYEDKVSIPGVLLAIFWMIILFATLASTADDFFCPSLEVLARSLRLSQNVAGVTLLAFGNGAPEIFASLAGTTKQRSNLVISYLLGSGMFLTCVVAGFIIISTPFKMVERPFLRDVIFYIVALFWTYWILHQKIVTLYGAVGFIGLYVVYISVVLIAHKIYRTWFKKDCSEQHSEQQAIKVAELANAEMQDHSTGNQLQGDEITPWGELTFRRNLTQSLERKKSLIGPTSLYESMHSGQPTDFVSSSSSSEWPLTPKNFKPSKYTTVKCCSECMDTFFDFLYGLCPVHADWDNMGKCEKICHFFKAPVILFLKLTIPVVSSWCRPLNALHCITSPLFFLTCTGYATYKISGLVPVWTIVAMFGSIFACIVMGTSTKDNPPSYHMVFALLGFCASVTWIYIIANEIVSLLTNLGLLLGISDAIIGLTILAWGNSINDVVADVSIAKEGYPRMGLSACFGGPLFNLLLGLGISFTTTIFKLPDRIIHVTLHRTTIIILLFLATSLISSLTIVPLMRFQMHRSYGIYLIVLYVTFIIVVVAAELNVF